MTKSEEVGESNEVRWGVQGGCEKCIFDVSQRRALKRITHPSERVILFKNLNQKSMPVDDNISDAIS